VPLVLAANPRRWTGPIGKARLDGSVGPEFWCLELGLISWKESTGSQVRLEVVRSHALALALGLEIISVGGRH